MKLHHYLTALLLATLPAGTIAAEPDAPPAAGGRKDGSLPKDVMGFYGSVTGTVEAVDAEAVTFKVKVTKAVGDASKNKAPKPEALTGMIIVVTPLAAKDKEGKSVLDEKASAYIKGAKSGDPVTLAVRASSKGVVFRLLKVPSAGGK